MQGKAIRIVCVAVMVVCAVMSIGLATLLASTASRAKLAYTDRVEEGQPPEVALGIAMGAFRGIFVNFLWIRANDLKQEGKFFELNQLAEAITRLQPRFPRVWVFHAWNLAYNISVGTNTRTERWYWVNAGISLLRDRAIPANPNDLLLHKELAWIYLHKIQGVTDDSNRYYKMKVAEEWQSLLGPPPPADPKDRSRDAAIARVAATMEPIAAAPTQLADVIAQTPSVRTLVDRIQKEVGEHAAIGEDREAGPDQIRQLLRRYEMIKAMQRSTTGKRAQQSMGVRTKALLALVDDPALQPAWNAYLAFARRYMIEQVYHMNAGDMLRFVRRYGPIDWRNPAAHSLYWSATGVERGLLRVTDANRKDYDFTNTDRLVIQSVQELYRTGRIFFDYFAFNLDVGSTYIAMPDPSFAETYASLMEEIDQRSAFDGKERAYSMYAAGYENFFIDVILYFYRMGMTDVANKYYRNLAVWPGANMNDPQRTEKFSKELDEWVLGQIADRQRSPNVAVQEVAASLLGAYAYGLLGGDMQVFDANMKYASQAHAYFMINQRRLSASDPANARMDVMEPDFRIHAGIVFAQFMTNLSLDQAAAAFQAAPDDLKRYSYDYVSENFRDPENKDLALNGEKFELVFGEPPGMAQHRKMLENYFRQKQERLKLQVEQK
ncbi:MAG: hypothetical protein K2Y21_08465 [Phycisphaerales bacterium]|nr:hypothetical protein [Phycisphaerales bacterium]